MLRLLTRALVVLALALPAPLAVLAGSSGSAQDPPEKTERPQDPPDKTERPAKPPKKAIERVGEEEDEGKRAPAERPERPGSPDEVEEVPPVPPLAERQVPDRLPSEIDPVSGEEVIVITNETLNRLFGPSGVARSGPAAEPRGEPAAAPPGASPSRAPSPAPVVDALSAEQIRQKVAEIEDELARLRQRAAGLRNPYLPRGQASEEEREKEQGLDAVERLRLIQERIDQLEAQKSKLTASGR